MPKTYNYHEEHKYSDFREIICTSAERFANRTVFEVKEDDGSKTNITYAQLKELYYGLCIKFIKMGYLGKLRVFIVGAAELDTSLVDDFAAFGIKTLQGYGLTESSPLLAGNGDFYINPASTGKAIPGVELKIDNPNEEGVCEILARGDNIMLGYFNDKEATDAVMRDGWFCTGDLGYIDEEGDLFIKGRIKNVIVTENGKNI